LPKISVMKTKKSIIAKETFWKACRCMISHKNNLAIFHHWIVCAGICVSLVNDSVGIIFTYKCTFRGDGTMRSFAVTFPTKDSGIQMLAGVAPSGQTVRSLLRTAWLWKLTGRMIHLEFFWWIYHVRLLITQQHCLAIIGE
jgi:hypothetical protein